MEMTRRGFLKGLAGILAAGVAPAVLPSGVIMPIKKLWVPEEKILVPQVFVTGNPGGTSWVKIWYERDGKEMEWRVLAPTEIYKGDSVSFKMPENTTIHRIQVETDFK